MHPRRLFAIGLSLGILLAANTYSGFALYAFTVGPQVQAQVTVCSGGKFSTCRGRWVLPDGRAGSGGVAGAGSSGPGETVSIRIAPLTGAYKDSGLVLGSRLFWAILVDAMTLVAWVWIAYMLIRSRRVAAAFDSTVEAGHEIWHSSNTAITDPLGTPLWHGCRARRRLTEITAPDAATNFHVRSADGVLALDYPDGTPAGRIEADRYAANRLSYTIFDATGTPRAYLASTGVTDSTWAATGVDETPYARFVLAPGRNHTALAPVTPPPLRPLLAAFLLDYDRMLLEGGTRPGGVAELQRRAKR